MPRNRTRLERASLAEAVATALRRSYTPLPTVEVIASVVGIMRYGDRALPLVAVQVPRTLRHIPGVVMSGTPAQRLWAIVEAD
jgi:hypothetical protein